MNVKEELNNSELRVIQIEEEKEVSVKINQVSSLESSNQFASSLKECMHDESKVINCINRRDVVIKSILRSMRKYYCDLIQDNTYYRRTMRNIKLKHKMLISCSNEITEKFTSTSEMRSTTFILASIAFPNDMKKILKLSCEEKKNSIEIVNEALEKISTIECAMNKFSMKNLSKFLEIYEVPILLMNYLSKY